MIEVVHAPFPGNAPTAKPHPVRFIIPAHYGNFLKNRLQHSTQYGINRNPPVFTCERPIVAHKGAPIGKDGGQIVAKGVRCGMVGEGWITPRNESGDGFDEATETTEGSRVNHKIEKGGVPRLHGNMPPGNSFPQICVVSVHKIVVTGGNTQEYLRVVAISNQSCLLVCQYSPTWRRLCCTTRLLVISD